MNARSAVTIHERSLVRWLFAESPGSILLRRELGVTPSSALRFEVREPVLGPEPATPGDVDVLIVDRNEPHRATAVECKRVIVRQATFQTVAPGKLQGLRRGIAQANALSQRGFHRTFLLVLVVVDGRERHEFNFIGRGLTPELVHAIDHFPARHKLLPEVGLGFAEIVQPVDRDISEAGGIGVRIARLVTPRTQPPALTEAIRSFFGAGAL